MKKILLPAILLPVLFGFLPGLPAGEAQAATAKILGRVDGVYTDDISGTVVLTGWAFDRNDYDRDVFVSICEGNGSFGCSEVPANLPRPDVDERYGMSRSEEYRGGVLGEAGHGFSFELPSYMLDGQPHELNAYIVKDDWQQGELLPGSPVIFTDTANFNLQGGVDAVEIDGTCTAQVRGWAVNYASQSNPVPIILSTLPIPTAYGPFATVFANLYRNDLTFIGTDGRHAFNASLTLPINPPDCTGYNSVYVYALDLNDGRLKLLGGHWSYKKDMSEVADGELVRCEESPATFEYRADGDGTGSLLWYPSEASYYRQVYEMNPDGVPDEETYKLWKNQLQGNLFNASSVSCRQLHATPVARIAPESVSSPCENCSAPAESIKKTYNLLKRPGNPEIFFVDETEDGTPLLRWLSDDAAIVTLYGNDWASRVAEIPDWVKIWLPVGPRITESDIVCSDAGCDVVD